MSDTTVFVARDIITMNASRPHATHVAIRDGRIIGAGSAEDAPAGMQAEGAASLAPPPPIDDDRRSRSPGLQNNFYDTSTADFKRPHGR